MPRYTVRTSVLVCFAMLAFPCALMAQWETKFSLNGVSPGQQMGAAVAGGFDFNNDGFGDVAVG